MKPACLALLLCAALTFSPVAAAAVGLPPVEGEVIVKFKPAAGVTRMHVLAAAAASDTAAVTAVLARRAATLSARVGRTLQAGAAIGESTQVVRAPGVDAVALAAQLATDPDVEYAVPNGRVRIRAAPNDPLYPTLPTGSRSSGPDSGQWYLQAPAATVRSSIDIEAAWLRSTGSAGVVVAVLDTGVRTSHPDLANRLLPGYDFISDTQVANDGDARDADAADPGDWVTSADLGTARFTDCDVSDSSWHGTMTGSLVGAATNDAIGMAGAAPGVMLLPVRVIGKCFGTDADIQAAMLWSAGIAVPGVPTNPNPARVLNLSLGGGTTCGASYQDVVNQVLARGATIVAAAGNSVGAPVQTPANCSGVVGVAGLRHAGTKVGFSSLGPEVAVAAPGGNCVNTAAGSPCLYPILAASDTGTTGPASPTWTDSVNPSFGTSFAAPLVAGVAALMVSAAPTLTPATVRARLQSTARAFPTTGGDNGDGSVVPQCTAPSSTVQQLQCYCTTTTCGAGMLDAGAAVAAVATAPQVQARITVATASPTAGAPVSLSAADSVLLNGAVIAGYGWSVVDGGGIVNGFVGATNGQTATVQPTAAGSFTVRLALTDALGSVVQQTSTVTVAAAPQPPAGDGGGGGGGGAASAAWVVLLAAAAAALGRRRGLSARPPRAPRRA